MDNYIVILLGVVILILAVAFLASVGLLEHIIWEALLLLWGLLRPEGRRR